MVPRYLKCNVPARRTETAASFARPSRVWTAADSVQHPLASLAQAGSWHFGSIPITSPEVPLSDVARRIRSAAGGGQALEASVHRHISRMLHMDITGVRVHTDSEADRLARALGSTAFTSRSDIFFRAGAYRPRTRDGLRLLTHEVVHTVQQSRGPVSGRPAPGGVMVSHPDDAFEKAAVRAAQGEAEGAGRGQVPALVPTGPTVVSAAVAVQRDDATGGRVFGGATTSAIATGIHDHYRIELKAWIPQESVVDPEAPFHVLEESSFFHGDGHPGYDGAYRVLTWIEFDWDGSTITNQLQGEDYGISRRSYVDRFALPVAGTSSEGFPTITSGPRVGEDTGRASCCTDHMPARIGPYGTTVTLGIHSSNPLVGVAPDIDSQLGVGFAADGSLTVFWITDRFPSHGFQILRNDSTLAKEVVFDASGIDARGPVGAWNIMNGLTSQFNIGIRHYRWRR